MAERSPSQGVRLQGAGAQSPDVGKSTVRLNRNALQTLGIREGEIIEVVGQFIRSMQPYKPSCGTNMPPLVLAGVEYLLPIYRRANTYPYLLDGGVTGNPEGRRPDVGSAYRPFLKAFGRKGFQHERHFSAPTVAKGVFQCVREQRVEHQTTSSAGLRDCR